MSYKKIESKNPGTTVTFKTPLADNLCRTGTIGDGSCFFHALLYGINPNYKLVKNEQKIEMVEDLRSEISKSLDISDWEKLGNGSLAILSYSEIYNELLNFFYRVVDDPSEFLKVNETNFINQKLIQLLFMGKFMGSYESLFKYITIDDFEKHILPKAFKKDINTIDNFLLDETKKLLINRVKERISQGDKVSKEQLKELGNTLYEMLSTLSKTARPLAYNKFIKNLESCDYWVDYYLIDYISNYVEKDIYIIDDTTRMPYRLGDCNMYKGRKSVIILWIGRSHYESIGRVNNKKDIIREFEPNDPLIERINAILCNPEKVKSDYPEFIKYLPREYLE
jgi:hypothetical protein